MKNPFCQIFEYELKKKLSERAKSYSDEIRLLLNCFKFYDLEYIGIIDKIHWVRGILRTGLTGFNEDDLLSIFSYYDINNSGIIDYKNFSFYLYGKEPLNPLPKLPNNNVFEPNNNIKNSNLNYHESNNDKNSYSSIIIKFKNGINTNNGVTYFNFVKKLKLYENNGIIKVGDLIQIFEEMQLDFNENEIIDFFNALDLNKMNYIFTNDIIDAIKVEISEERIKNILNKFYLIDMNGTGRINVSYLKYIFKNNCRYHPDVSQGIKNEETINNQFCQSLDIFLNINNIINDTITKDQFINFFSGISASIPNDIYFNNMINSIFNLSGIYNDNANNNRYSTNNRISNYMMNSYINNSNNRNRNNQEKRRFISKSLSSPDIISQDYNQKSLFNNNNNNNKIRNNIFQNDFYHINGDRVENIRYNQSKENKNDFNKNLNSISDPYYRPRITPGKKGRRIFKQIIYNPITNQLLFDNLNQNNNNNKDNNDRNHESLAKSPVTRYKNNIFIFNEDKYKKQILLELFNKLRNEIISKGEKSIFIVQKLLPELNMDNNKNLISFDNLCFLCQKLQIRNINDSELKKIFEFFDKDNIGYINYDDLFKNLVGFMGRARQNIVRRLYDSLNKDQNGNIFSMDLKTCFNASKYNDIFGCNKTKEDIYYDFIDNFEIFLNYKNKLYNEDMSNKISYNDFLRFFGQISMYINNDETFEKYINSCWIGNLIEFGNSKHIFSYRNYNRYS